MILKSIYDMGCPVTGDLILDISNNTMRINQGCKVFFFKWFLEKLNYKKMDYFFMINNAI
jgi:hypothetical protein